MKTKIFLIAIIGILIFSNCKKEDKNDHGYVYIPTVFTPNDDFLNEGFTAQGYDIDSVGMVITNSDGQILYKNSSRYGVWNGRNEEGKIYPRGMYFYNIYVRFADGIGERYIGTVELSMPCW